MTESGNYRIPLQVELTRPKEKYKMRVTYQSPGKILIGNEFPAEAFTLKNSWGLEELSLDDKLREATAGPTPVNEGSKTGTQD